MKEICKVLPGTYAAIASLGITVTNHNQHKAMYVRLGRKSVTVSDRKPAAYGVRKRA